MDRLPTSNRFKFRKRDCTDEITSDFLPRQIKLLRRRRILRRVQRTKKPEVLFNRVVKRIHEFVLVTLFEATCKRRAVSEVQNRVPATSRSGQIFSVCVWTFFFVSPFLSRPGTILKAESRKNSSKRGDFEGQRPSSRH